MSEFISPRELVPSLRRVVVKIGTSVLAGEGKAVVSRHAVESVAAEAAALRRAGIEVILVTSGAIGAGMGVLGFKSRPRRDLAKLQAAAAAGQGRLMQWYSGALEREGYHAAQLLLTREDLEDPRRYRNVKATLTTLLKAKAIPIINENDTVSTEEIRYGDNDLLSAHVALLTRADLLAILSDVDRFRGPDGPQTLVTRITPEMERAAGGAGRVVSSGGMRTKLEAARLVMAGGIPMVFMNGRRPGSLAGTILKKELRGTWFVPRKGVRIKGGQGWAVTGKPKGTIFVDAGAREALTRQGRSLLASGVRAVEGDFRRGDVVAIADAAKSKEFARGIVRYSRTELEKIKGLRSEAAGQALGRKPDEVAHRDSMVILRRDG